MQKNRFGTPGYAGLRGTMNDRIHDCPKEFDKTVVFRVRSGKIQPVFGVALDIDAPSKANTSVLANYYLCLSEFGGSTVPLHGSGREVLLTGSLMALRSQSGGHT